MGEPDGAGRKGVLVAVGARLIVARLHSQRLVLGAAFVTIILATTLLTALYVYVGAAATAGIRTAITSAPEPATGAMVHTTAADSATLAPIDDYIRGLLDETFAAVPHETARRLESDNTYTLPARAGQGAEDELTVFVAYEGLADHADLVSGAWPAATSAAPVEVALPQLAAETLGLATGSALTVVQRLDEVPIEVVVTGTYDPVEPTNWYWRNDPLDTRGMVVGATYPIIGPFVVADETTLAAAVAAAGLDAEWRLGADWSVASPADVGAVRTALPRLTDDLRTERDEPLTGAVQVETELTEILTSLQRSLLSNQSMMLIPVLQLALLAAYTLLLAARLLSEHRRTETSLLQARGGSTNQLIGLALRETAFLVAPAAVLAPLLALLLVRVAEGRGPFGSLAAAATSPQLSWWLVSGTTAMLCGAALVVPTLRPQRTYVENQAERGRQGRRSALQRAGADLLLVGAAALAYWQLLHYESPVLGSGVAAQIDPLLVLGPCLALFAAAAVALRLLPHVANLAQRLAARRPALAGALGAWQVSRRPLRYTGPALLLVLALAIGGMSTAYGASWRLSQADQADFQAGADIRIQTATDFDAMPLFGQAGALAATPGTETLVPVWEDRTSLGDEPVQVLALDSATAPQAVTLRADLASADLATLMRPLAEAQPAEAGIAIPGEPTQLAMTVTARLGYDEPGAPPLDPRSRNGSLRVTVEDAFGSTFILSRDSIVYDGATRDIVLDLTALATGGTDVEAAAPAYPLRLIGVTASAPLVSVYTGSFDQPVDPNLFFSATARLDIVSALADDAPITVPDGFDWDSEVGITGFPGSGLGDAVTATIDTPPDGFLAIALEPETGLVAVTELGVALSSGVSAPIIPILLDRRAAAAAATRLGETVTLQVGGVTYQGEVSGIVEAFPGTSAASGVVVLDYATLARGRFVTGESSTAPTGWWLTTSDPGATAAALDDAPFLAASVVSRERLTDELRTDPLGAATLGALLAGFVAALGFAAVGFAVNLVIGARERMSEFAVLRALGVSRRQVLRMLLVEQAFLVGLGVGVGLLIGVVVSALVVPLVVLSPQALRTVPPVLLAIPWPVLGAVVVGTVVALGLLVAVAARQLQRQGLGGALRLGEET